MKIKYRLLKIGVCSILLILMMSFSLKRFKNATFKEFNIEIKDQNTLGFIKEEDVQKVFYKNFSNTNSIQIKDINVEEVEHQMQKSPYIDSLNVYLDQNQKLNVYVEQKEPLVRIHKGNTYYYIGESLEPIPISKQFSKKCLLVEGNINPEEYASLIQLQRSITEDNLLTKHIVGIKKQNHNSFNLWVNVDDFYIEFGNLNNIEQKLINLKAFYRQYLNHIGVEKYKKISVKYNNQIVATRK